VYLLNSAKLESLDEATLSFDQTIIDNFNPYGFSTFDVDDGVLYYIDQVREETMRNPILTLIGSLKSH